MVPPKKIVLVSRSGYSPSHDDILRELIARKVVLFCAVGRDCQLWEEIMDELVVGLTGDGDWHITTTSHPSKSVGEVVEFARAWNLDEPSDVEIIEV